MKNDSEVGDTLLCYLNKTFSFIVTSLAAFRPIKNAFICKGLVVLLVTLYDIYWVSDSDVRQ